MPNNIIQQTPYLQSGLPQNENRLPDGYSGGQLGSRFTFKDPEDSNIAKKYQLVQADSVMDVVPADNLVAYWLEASGYRVTTDVSVAGRGKPAGIFRTAVTLGNICCIQIGGPGDVLFSAGTPDATGLIAIPTATDGQAQALAAGTAATYPPLGVTLSTAVANVARVELQLPGRE